MVHLLKKPWGLLFLLVFVTAGCRGKEVVGTPAVDFTFKGINGGQIAYSDLKGKPTILYFFASW
jgi:cytochrome oxidase Cu insertion factor (SCO1/SenC/PrrC family)